MKDRELSLLMLMVLKRNGDLNSRVVAHGRCQRKHAEKNECSSHVPDFCSLKHSYGVVSKEDRDIFAVDLPGFFLQKESNDEDEPMLLKITGDVYLLLFGSDETK